MRNKIITFILCFSIVISPSLANSYQTNNPDPEFLGNFMVHNFLESQFNLKESQEYQKALSNIPENIRGLTEVWTLIYLSWVFSDLVNEKYGDQFTDKMLETANKKWVKAGELSGEYLEVFKFWFPTLDNLAKESIGKTFQGKEIPLEVFTTWAFLAQDSSSPFFQQANPDIENNLAFTIAIALAEAKDGTVTYMKNVVDIGGPIDNETVEGSQYINDKDIRQPNPPQVSKKDPTENSIEDAQDQVRQRPNDPNAHFNLGKAYFLSGQYQEAIKPFKEAITNNPDYSLAHYALGASYFELGQNQESINSYKKATQVNPNHALSHKELGLVYSSIGQHEKAIASVKEAIRLKPDLAKAYIQLGGAYIDNDQFQEAIFSLKEGLRLQPDDFDGYIDLGFVYNKLRRYEEAIESFSEAIRIKPENALAHFNLGVAYHKLGRREESISEYKEALRIDPEITSARKNLNIIEKKVASERALLEKKIKALDALSVPRENKKNQNKLPTHRSTTTRSSIEKDYKDGLDAYERKDYVRALNNWRPLAEQGVAVAQFSLGQMYRQGYGVPQDHKESARLFLLAAKQGRADAQSNLGALYYKGIGVPQDYNESFRWRKLAAKQGEPTAQLALGSMYYMGIGVDKDYIQAHKWTSMAIINGKEDASELLELLAKEMTTDQIIEARSLTKDSSSESYESFKVAGSNFFVKTRKTKDDDWEFNKSNLVPLVPENTCYGWVIELNTQLNFVQVKEVLTMPYIPKNVNLADHYSFGNDGKSIIGQSSKEIKDNYIGNIWCVVEDDPSGNHNIDVFVEGTFVKSFPFTVGYGEVPSVARQPETNKEIEKSSKYIFKDFGEYLTLASALYSQYMEILGSSSEINELGESFLDEKITSEYAIDQKNIISIKAELKLKSLNKKLSEFTLPRFKIPTFKEIAQDFNSYLNTLPKLIRKSVDLSYKLFDAAINQDIELYNDLDIRSRTTLVNLLEGENNYLNLIKVNIPHDSPGYKYYSVVQYANRVLIYINKARVSDFIADTPSNELEFLTGDSQAYIKIAKAELTKGQDIINASDLVINDWVNKQRITYSDYPQYLKTFELMGKSLAKSFEVENNIVLLLQGLISEYPNVESLDKFDILLDKFIDERMELQDDRTRLLTNFKG